MESEPLEGCCRPARWCGHKWETHDQRDFQEEERTQHWIVHGEWERQVSRMAPGCLVSLAEMNTVKVFSFLQPTLPYAKNLKVVTGRTSSCKNQIDLKTGFQQRVVSTFFGCQIDRGTLMAFCRQMPQSTGVPHLSNCFILNVNSTLEKKHCIKCQCVIRNYRLF